MEGRVDIKPQLLQGELRRCIEGMLELGQQGLVVLYSGESAL